MRFISYNDLKHQPDLKKRLSQHTHRHEQISEQMIMTEIKSTNKYVVRAKTQMHDVNRVGGHGSFLARNAEVAVALTTTAWKSIAWAW